MRFGASMVVAGLAVTVGLVAASCSSSGKTAATTTTQEPVAAAQTRVDAAQANVTKTNDALTAAHRGFCSAAGSYVTTLDRYGKLFTDTKATVGDVKTSGADLVAPRDAVSAAVTTLNTAQTDVANATKELADAQAALAQAKATASSVAPPSTTPASTTTTTLVPPATISRVKQAEADFTSAAQGITDATPLAQATTTFNSAAFALEVAWLRLLADAGCLTDAQHSQAAAQLTEYTTALQKQLQTAGYYKDTVDGVYGPQTVNAVKQLQTDSGLPATGYVDQATAAALDAKVGAVNQQNASQAQTEAAAVQTVLKLTGYWSGPIDGKWTPALTDALKAFQTALGVEPTGAVDVATLAAFEQALADLKTAATTTTTAATTTTTPSTTTTTTTTAPAPTTTTTAAATATSSGTTPPSTT
jgi:peptidoglycan hydrolase-like protein with peptidoglycan-binding domain